MVDLPAGLPLNPPSFSGCEVPDLANVTVSRDVGSVVPDKDTVMYSCNEGYSLDNAARLVYLQTI